MKEKIRNLNKNKILGIAIILIALIVGGIFVYKTFIMPKAVITQEQSNNTTKDKEVVITDDTIQNEETIDSVKTHVSYYIPEQIQAKFDMDSFDVAFKKFLEDNQLYTQDTKANSDGILIEDYNKGYFSFNLILNNYNNNTVICTITESGEYSFDFY